MRKLRDAVIDAVSKQAITDLMDSFGNRLVVQTPLLAAGADHAKDVADATTLLQANEDEFITKLKQMGLTDEQIEALKK